MNTRILAALPAAALAGVAILGGAAQAHAVTVQPCLPTSTISWLHQAGTGYAAHADNTCAPATTMVWDIKRNGVDWEQFSGGAANGVKTSPWFQVTRGDSYQAVEKFYYAGSYLQFATSGSPDVLAQ